MNIDIQKLPSPPGVAVKLLELFSNSDVGLDDMCSVIGVDPVLTARIVSYANSPKFARRYSAETLNQATALLGVNGVKMIALSFSLTDTKSDNDSDSFKFQEFWKSSLATAVCSRNVFDASGLEADAGFLMGLLFNVGQLAIATSEKEKYQEILAGKSVGDLELIKLETEILDANRYQIAVEVLKAWNFPETMIQTFESGLEAEGESSKEFQCLRLATEMSYSFLEVDPDYEFIQSITTSLIDLLGLEEGDTDEFYSKALADYSELAEILAYDLPPQRTLAEIELEGKTRIVELTMDLHHANTQVTEENSELKSMAYIDALTGLGNRRQYDSTVGAEYDRCKRMGAKFSLLVCDIDFFKKVNDVHGHAAGDAILAGVAKRISDGLRAYDHVFRFGGEEFVVLLPETETEITGSVAERIRASIESEAFEYEGTQIPVTLSLGGAVFDPQNHNVSVEALFQMADDALYKAKKGGRNQYQLAAPSNAMPVVMPETTSDNSMQNS